MFMLALQPQLQNYNSWGGGLFFCRYKTLLVQSYETFRDDLQCLVLENVIEEVRSYGAIGFWVIIVIGGISVFCI